MAIFYMSMSRWYLLTTNHTKQLLFVDALASLESRLNYYLFSSKLTTKSENLIFLQFSNGSRISPCKRRQLIFRVCKFWVYCAERNDNKHEPMKVSYQEQSLFVNGPSLLVDPILKTTPTSHQIKRKSEWRKVIGEQRNELKWRNHIDPVYFLSHHRQSVTLPLDLSS